MSTYNHGWSFLFSWWGFPTNFELCHINFILPVPTNCFLWLGPLKMVSSHLTHTKMCKSQHPLANMKHFLPWQSNILTLCITNFSEKSFVHAYNAYLLLRPRPSCHTEPTIVSDCWTIPRTARRPGEVNQKEHTAGKVVWRLDACTPKQNGYKQSNYRRSDLNYGWNKPPKCYQSLIAAPPRRIPLPVHPSLHTNKNKAVNPMPSPCPHHQQSFQSFTFVAT